MSNFQRISLTGADNLSDSLRDEFSLPKEVLISTNNPGMEEKFNKFWDAIEGEKRRGFEFKFVNLETGSIEKTFETSDDVFQIQKLQEATPVELEETSRKFKPLPSYRTIKPGRNGRKVRW